MSTLQFSQYVGWMITPQCLEVPRHTALHFAALIALILNFMLHSAVFSMNAAVDLRLI